jgi:hypothetical protein
VKKLRTVKSDPQREAFYAAEREFNPRRRYKIEITLGQARAVVADIRRLYGLPPVSVRRVAPPGPTFAAEMLVRYRNDGTVMSGQIRTFRGKYALTLHTVLHEMAHFIKDCYLTDVQSHGPEFAGIFMWLYNHFKVIPADALAVVYRRYKIRFKSLPESSPAALRSLDIRRSRA